jgi:hypothetical protein
LTNPPEVGVGCLVFVVDDRLVVADFDPEKKTELRLATTFGDNIWPEYRQRGFLELAPAPGKFLYGLHMIGIREKRMTIFDKWMNGFTADDATTVEQAERQAREILAGISDEQYASPVKNGSRDGPTPKVKRSAPVELVGWELIANEAHL